MDFQIKIADVVIKIQHRYNYIYEICKDYLTKEEPDFWVSVTEEQIKEELELTKGKFPAEMCESTCIHREIVKGLVKYHVILIHSAVVAVDGTAYVFMAKSGVGKSTHIRLWKEVFGEKALVVNGDKPLFSFKKEKLMVYGTPWRGKEQFGENCSMPVGGICILDRGKENKIAPAEKKEIVDRIFHQVLLPGNVEDLAVFMEIINRMIAEVPFYTLQCNMEKEAALVAYEGISNVFSRTRA